MPTAPKKKPTKEDLKARTKTVGLDEIQPYWRNPRDNDNAIEATMESLEKFGQQIPLVVDRENVIIAGHTRWKAMKKMGWETCEIIISDLDEDAARGYRIIDNKTSEKATWNIDNLIPELRAWTGVEDFQIHFPELNFETPNMDFSMPHATQDQVDQMQNQKNNQFTDALDQRNERVKSFTCPHCGENFDALL